MKAILNGNVLAESDDIVSAGGYDYFPLGAARIEWLEKSPQHAEGPRMPARRAVL